MRSDFKNGRTVNAEKKASAGGPLLQRSLPMSEAEQPARDGVGPLDMALQVIGRREGLGVYHPKSIIGPLRH